MEAGGFFLFFFLVPFASLMHLIPWVFFVLISFAVSLSFDSFYAASFFFWCCWLFDTCHI